MIAQSHSFYPSKYPKAGEVVMTKITKITDLGVYVELLEYNNIEGLIVVGELSKKKIKSVASLVKIGKIEAAMVIRVDSEKGYIDLSRKKVSTEDYRTCIQKYNQNKMAHSVMVLECKARNSRKINCTINDLYEEYFAKAAKSSLYNYFLKVLTNEIKDEIHESVKKKYNLAKYKVRADVDVTSHNIGIEAVKEALQAGKNVDKKVEIALIKTPIYCILLSIGDKEEGIRIVNLAIEKIKETITKSGGRFKMAGEVEVYGEKGSIDVLCDKMDDLIDGSFDEADTADEDE
ncbi:hypothetical protein BDAP_000051 [Binucleata daphniae]